MLLMELHRLSASGQSDPRVETKGDGKGSAQTLGTGFGRLRVIVPPSAASDLNPDDHSPTTQAGFTRFFDFQREADRSSRQRAEEAPAQAYMRMSNGDLVPVVQVAGLGGDLIKLAKGTGAAAVSITKSAGRAVKDFSDGATTGYVNAVTLGGAGAAGLVKPPKNVPEAMGRVVGDGMAIVQGMGEVGAGTGGGVAGLATGPGELVIAPSAAAVVAHGVGTTVAAVVDAGRVLASAMSGKTGEGGSQEPESKATETKSSPAPGQTAAGQATDKYGNKLSRSGKPQINTVKHSTKKAAKDAARAEGRGKPEKHASPENPEQGPHYHPVDEAGKKKSGSTHHEYPH